MNHFSYPLTFIQINIFEEPQNIFSTQIPDPKLSSQPPIFFTIECPLGMENSFGFCTTIFGKVSWDLQLSGAPTVVESTSGCPKYLKFLRVPPVVQSISSCPEHLQLSKVSPVIDNISSYQEYPQLSRVPPLVQSTSSCRE